MIDNDVFLFRYRCIKFVIYFVWLKNSENVSIFIFLFRIRGLVLKDVIICDIMYCIFLIWKEREKKSERERERKINKY